MRERRSPAPPAKSKRVKPNSRAAARTGRGPRERDPDGRSVVHHRTVDTLGRLLRAGAIDQAMYDAAKDLQAAFIVASLDLAAGSADLEGTGHRPRPGP